MSTCLMCGGAEARELFRGSDRLYGTTDREFAVVRCAACGLIRLDPMPEAAELARYYPKSYWFAPDSSPAGRLEETYRRLVLRDHVGFVERALLSSGTRGLLLDVGAGGGLFLGMMRERGFRVAALDFSREAAAVAWKRQSVPAVCGMLEAAPFAPCTFGGITMFHVVEHLRDPRAYLETARKLLAPGGRLVVQVPNAASWQFHFLRAAWTGIDIPRHLVDFRARDLEQLLLSCGFEVVRKKFFSLRDNPAGLASSLAPGLDPMARRIRGVPEGRSGRLVKDLIYFAMVVASVAPAALEAACRMGSTVMIEARRP